MWIVCITSVRHVLTVNGYGGRQTKENEKSWCFKGWETLVSNGFSIFRVIMDKRIENAMNELINTEIWSTGLYLSLQVYFEDERLPILAPG